MKTNLQKISYFLLSFMVITFFGCEDNSGQIEMLSQQNTELRNDYDVLLSETRAVTKKSDSLQTTVNKLQSQVAKLKGEQTIFKASNKEETAIEVLVANMHKGWALMLKNDDTNELLRYFLPKYTTSTVRINTENIPSVDRKNDANFEDHLNELLMTDDVSISFGQTKFLYTEIKDNFFVTSYQTRIRVYQKDKQVYTSSLVTLLAGENKEGWKVGSYNWVTFNYD